MSMNTKSPSAKSSNKVSKGRGKSTKPHPEFAALQHVLHQPFTQQMMGTPRTQWKEIGTVADTLKKLSLLNSGHRSSSREGGIT